MTELETEVLQCTIHDSVELNLSYMPFISEGGFFVPTDQKMHLGENVLIDLQLPGKKEALRIKGKVIWITPKNALHHVLPGVGIQFTDTNAQVIRADIEANLDKTMEVGGYTYGMMAEMKK